MTNPQKSSHIGAHQTMPLNSVGTFQALVKSAYSEISVRAIPGSCLDDFIALIELKDQLKLKLIPTAIVVVLKNRYDEKSHYSFDQLANLFKPVFHVLPNDIKKELRFLTGQKIVDRYSRDGISYYRLSEDAKNALEDADLEYFWDSLPIGIEGILTYCREELFNFHKISKRKMYEFYEEIEELNPDLSLIKFIQDAELYVNTSELYTFFGTILKSFDSSDSFRYYSTEEYMGCHMVEKMALKMQIVEGDWILIRKGYIEVTGGGYKDSTPELRLTEKGFAEILKGIDPNVVEYLKKQAISIATPILKWDNIKPVELHFEGELKTQTGKIQRLLSGENFEKYALTSPNKSKGISMLFYGDPGCGKTEFALQLARNTQRSIIQINVSDIMSKWVGESEGNLKRIFRDYNRATLDAANCPILFINEADQLISKRFDANNSVDQMHNGLQNILLEEMENFNGILIGTTNLQRNMDAAFERRWLIKINFNKPSALALSSIWKQFVPEFSDEEVQVLIRDFSLSPGEIMNVVKRLEIEKLLGLDVDVFSAVYELCRSERFIQSHSKQIGFISK
jgi:hypothetical protein